MKNEQITFRQSLFWDVDPKTIDIEKNARDIIERILDFGDDNEVRWMWNRYNHALIRDVVDRSRGLFPATRSFWNLMLST